MNRPERPIASDWLELRRAADERARSADYALVDALSEHFPNSTTGRPVHIIDLGSGTGANLEWLAPRLRFNQKWTLLDHDPELLGLVPIRHGEGRVQQITRMVAGIEDLGTFAQALDENSLITCSAVLDLLRVSQLDGLCDFLVERGLPALLSLSVTGVVKLRPAHALDAQVNTAFNLHQSRGDLAGPKAVGHVSERLRAAGMRVDVVDTPWNLGPANDALMRRYLRDRAGAVTEQEPALAASAAAWLADRLVSVDEGLLHLDVGHRDLLCLPPR